MAGIAAAGSPRARRSAIESASTALAGDLGLKRDAGTSHHRTWNPRGVEDAIGKEKDSIRDELARLQQRLFLAAGGAEGQWADVWQATSGNPFTHPLFELALLDRAASRSTAAPEPETSPGI